MKRISKLIVPLIYILLTAAAVTPIFFYKQDVSQTYLWTIFHFWLAVFLAALIFSLSRIPRIIFRRILFLIKEDRYLILTVFIAACITRFILLLQYPFVTLGDELRDAGLNALNISRGVNKNIFGFGDYSGYGNFIPLISFYFHYLFGFSALIYRLPSALAGIFSVMGTYFIGRYVGGKKIALAASLFLISSFVHLHYSRTELLVILDSLLSILTLLSAGYALKHKEGFFLLGLVVGLSPHFYIGIRGILVITAVCIALYQLYNMIKKIRQERIKGLLKESLNTGVSMLLVVMGIVIGLGPTLHEQQKINLLDQKGNAGLLFEDQSFLNKNLPEKVVYLYKTYEKAFLVYFSEPTTTHFAYKASILTFPVNWFFLCGLFYLIINIRNKKNSLTGMILTLVMLFPLTNEVIVSPVGADHRMMSIVPFLVLTASFGAVMMVRTCSGKYETPILLMLIMIISSSQLVYYFTARLSDLSFTVNDYAFQYALNYLKKNSENENILIMSDENPQFNFNFIHYREKVDFFMYPGNTRFLTREEIKTEAANNPAGKVKIITFSGPFSDFPGYQSNLITKNCLPGKIFPRYDCPKNFDGTVNFYVSWN